MKKQITRAQSCYSVDVLDHFKRLSKSSRCLSTTPTAARSMFQFFPVSCWSPHLPKYIGGTRRGARALLGWKQWNIFWWIVVIRCYPERKTDWKDNKTINCMRKDCLNLFWHLAVPWWNPPRHFFGLFCNHQVPSEKIRRERVNKWPSKSQSPRQHSTILRYCMTTGRFQCNPIISNTTIQWHKYHNPTLYNPIPCDLIPVAVPPEFCYEQTIFFHFCYGKCHELVWLSVFFLWNCASFIFFPFFFEVHCSFSSSGLVWLFVAPVEEAASPLAQTWSPMPPPGPDPHHPRAFQVGPGWTLVARVEVGIPLNMLSPFMMSMLCMYIYI